MCRIRGASDPRGRACRPRSAGRGAYGLPYHVRGCRRSLVEPGLALRRRAAPPWWRFVTSSRWARPTLSGRSRTPSNLTSVPEAYRPVQIEGATSRSRTRRPTPCRHPITPWRVRMTSPWSSAQDACGCRDVREGPAPRVVRGPLTCPGGAHQGWCGPSSGGFTGAKPPVRYLLILVTRPAPTVRPPSRMAKRRPSSMAIGWMSSTRISVLSPGMTISVPSGRCTTPVTSVVRK